MRESIIICGKWEDVCFRLKTADMIFADPPDNIGLKYAGPNSDNLSGNAYRALMDVWLDACKHVSDVIWWSFNAKHDLWLTKLFDGFIDTEPDLEVKRFIWYFTFGQHCQTDCGNNYRPIFRIAPKDFKWNTDAIRIESKRQKMGDKRADPRGRVPGDVWGGPEDAEGMCRIQGNHPERRPWHPTQHPEKLVERAILMSTNPGDLVIDPFMGTGTTMRVCQRIGRACVTVDPSEEYCRRVSEETGVAVR